MKHADILKAWKVKPVAFCLFPLWAWLSLRNRFSRCIAGHRASPCGGIRDAKLSFTCPWEPIITQVFLFWGWEWGLEATGRKACGWDSVLGHSCDHMWSQVPLIPQSIMMEGTSSKNSWINLLVPRPFQTWFWTFINFYFKHNSQRLWKPTERLEWRPLLSWRGYNLCPVRTGLLEACIHSYFCLGFGTDLILYHRLAYETPIGAACIDLLHSCWHLRDR